MKENINYKKIYMIGIGGVSMSGIASILLSWGYEITGSDGVKSEMTDKLESQGAKIYIGHNADNIDNPDLVVYTAAISKDNPELVKAKELDIKLMERAEFLGELTKLYSKTIAISGTHGKTTTTGMISLCFIEALLDPSIQIGSVLSQIDGNYKVGSSDYFIIEACEYVDSFLSFYPQTEIILNIEEEHLDYFSGIEQIKESFIKFTNILPTNGNLIINIDNIECVDILKSMRKDINIYTYSLKDETADIYGYNIRYDDNGFGIFDIKYKDTVIADIHLNVPGIHNISNACSAVATCIAHNIDFEIIKKGLSKFTGTKRRFEFKGRTINETTVIDDYAHHPTEVKALLNSVKKKENGKVYAIFQPHTYSRLKNLLNEFSTCFDNADIVIVTDIYAAREIDDGTVKPEMLVYLINEKTPNKSMHISSFEDITDYLNNNTNKQDIILTIGAGTITKLSEYIVK